MSNKYDALYEEMYKEMYEELAKEIRPSAFRAINGTADQPVQANTFVKVLFPNVQFDLAHEYHLETSTFIPATDGVYSVLGTIVFKPENYNLDYRSRVEIRLNGNPAIAIDNDFFGRGIEFLNSVNVSTILQLHAGDRVEVYAQSSVSGSIVTTDYNTRFEAGRYPSPVKSHS